MIKLFLNILKKLLQEDKTNAYLKYAIGEIVLVVIITGTKTEKIQYMKNAFLTDIIGDLDKDATKLDYLKAFCKKNIEIHTTLITQVRNPIDKISIFIYLIIIFCIQE